jgi:hypothetical protein
MRPSPPHLRTTSPPPLLRSVPPCRPSLPWSFFSSVSLPVDRMRRARPLPRASRMVIICANPPPRRPSLLSADPPFSPSILLVLFSLRCTSLGSFRHPPSYLLAVLLFSACCLSFRCSSVCCLSFGAVARRPVSPSLFALRCWISGSHTAPTSATNSRAAAAVN